MRFQQKCYSRRLHTEWNIQDSGELYRTNAKIRDKLLELCGLIPHIVIHQKRPVKFCTGCVETVKLKYPELPVNIVKEKKQRNVTEEITNKEGENLDVEGPLEMDTEELTRNIKIKIQQLCNELSTYGDDAMVLTVNVAKKTKWFLGSTKGMDFLRSNVYILQEFLKYCSDGISATSNSSRKLNPLAFTTEAERTVEEKPMCLKYLGVPIYEESSITHDEGPNSLIISTKLFHKKSLEYEPKVQYCNLTSIEKSSALTCSQDCTVNVKPELEDDKICVYSIPEVGNTTESPSNDIRSQFHLRSDKSDVLGCQSELPDSEFDAIGQSCIHSSHSDVDKDLSDDNCKPYPLDSEFDACDQAYNNSGQTNVITNLSNNGCKSDATSDGSDVVQQEGTNNEYDDSKGLNNIDSIELSSNIEIYENQNGRTVSSDSDLKIQTKKLYKKNVERRYKCDVCPSSFMMELSLLQHKQNVHDPENEKRRCNICNKTFLHKTGLEKHMKMHDLLSSITEKHIKPEDRVEGDSRKFSSKNRKAGDTISVGSDGVDENSSVYKIGTVTIAKCNICQKIFSKKGDLKKHIQDIHNPVFDFNCDVCNKAFPSSDRLNRHKKCHFNIHSRCPTCKEMFSSNKEMRRHHAVEHKCDSFQCHICGKKCTKNYLLEVHMMDHTGRRPFVCQICSKSFKTKKHLARHELIHGDCKPAVCEICGKQFRDSSSVVIHNRHAHAKEEWICDHCGKCLSSRKNLDYHMLAQHFDQCNEKQLSLKYYTCEFCGKILPDKPRYESHRNTHTGDKPHKCPYCSESFGSKCSLRYHSKVHK